MVASASPTMVRNKLKAFCLDEMSVFSYLVNSNIPLKRYIEFNFRAKILGDWGTNQTQIEEKDMVQYQ